jgi:hypothetical protein
VADKRQYLPNLCHSTVGRKGGRGCAFSAAYIIIKSTLRMKFLVPAPESNTIFVQIFCDAFFIFNPNHHCLGI